MIMSKNKLELNTSCCTSSRLLIEKIIKDEMNGRHCSRRELGAQWTFLNLIFGQLTASGKQGLPQSMVFNILPTLLLASVALAYSPEEPLLFDSFPDDFLWGSATAAYQATLTSSQITYFSPKDWGCLEWGRKRAEHLGCFHEGNSLSHFLSHPRFPAPSLMAQVETSPVTATITTRRMCVLWRRWVWPAIGSSSPLVWIQLVW